MLKKHNKFNKMFLLTSLLSASVFSLQTFAQDGFYAELTGNQIISTKINNQVNVEQEFSISADIYLQGLDSTRDIFAIKGAKKDKVLVTNHQGHILLYLEKEGTVSYSRDPVLQTRMWHNISVSYDKKNFFTLTVDGQYIPLTSADYYLTENGLDATASEGGAVDGAQYERLVVGSPSYQGLIDNVVMHDGADASQSSVVVNWTFEDYNSHDAVAAADGTSITGISDALKYDRQVVGSYFPYYKIKTISPEVAKHLTHMYYFSFGPNEQGELGRITRQGNFIHLNDIPTVATDIATLNSWREGLNTKLIVVLGGWVQSDFLDEAARDPIARKNLVQNIRNFIDKYDLDGVDIDWEGYHGWVSPKYYGELLKEFRANFEGTDLEITATIAANGHKQPTLARHFQKYTDFVQLMSYGATIKAGTQYPLGAIDWNYKKWQEVGLDKEKIVMGLPAFSRSAGNKTPRALTYKKIMELYNPSPDVDMVQHLNTEQYFNGIETIAEKTNYNLRRGTRGVMIWEQGQDVEIGHPQSILATASGIIGVNTQLDE